MRLTGQAAQRRRAAISWTRSCPRSTSRPMKSHALRSISSAWRSRTAPMDQLIEKVTHTPGQGRRAFDRYERADYWPQLCAEVGKIEIAPNAGGRVVSLGPRRSTVHGTGGGGSRTQVPCYSATLGALNLGSLMRSRCHRASPSATVLHQAWCSHALRMRSAPTRSPWSWAPLSSAGASRRTPGSSGERSCACSPAIISMYDAGKRSTFQPGEPVRAPGDCWPASGCSTITSGVFR